MARMTMIQSIRSAMDNAMERDDNVVVFGEDVGFFRRRFPLHPGPATEVWEAALLSILRSMRAESSAPQSGMAAYGTSPVR